MLVPFSPSSETFLYAHNVFNYVKKEIIVLYARVAMKMKTTMYK